MNIRNAFVFLLVLGLAACSAGQQDATSPAAVADTSDTPCPQGQAYAFMPDEALEVSFPFHLRSDRIYLKQTELRRGIELEYLQGEPAGVWAGLRESLGTAGYAPLGERSVDSKGVIRQNYSKDGRPNLFVAVIPDAGRKPANPDAKGVVRFSWPIQAEGEPQQDGQATH